MIVDIVFNCPFNGLNLMSVNNLINFSINNVKFNKVFLSLGRLIVKSAKYYLLWKNRML